MARLGRRRQLICKAAAVVAVMTAWVMMKFRSLSRSRRGITYGPLSAREAERNANLAFIYQNDDRRCVEQLRMRRAPFFQLCDMFRNRALLRDSFHLTIEEQVAMFLLVVGHNQRFRVLTPLFRRSLETISRYFHEVLYAVGELRDDLIVSPDENTPAPAKIANSNKWYPFFEDCVGAIDGTHVDARVAAKHKAAFMGRKRSTTQNVLAAVDFDLRFTYVLAGWEGSAHDARVLTNALEREDGLRVPTGKFFLVDAGYAVRPGFLPPYRATRYHLREFGASRPQTPKELFNLRHCTLRTTVERAFGALKGRFRVLYNRPFHPYRTQVKVVLACCIIHNWILRFGQDEIFPLEEEWIPNAAVEVPNPFAEEVANPEAPEGLAGNGGQGAGGQGAAGQGAAGHGAGARMNWTSVMSSRMLCKFAMLVAEGIRTDKGFKEIHYNGIAKDLSAFMGFHVTSSQVANHLRKWRQKWVKIVKLKDLSGAGWDEEKCMITLDDDHFSGHIKDHPKDEEFLNVPLPNYNYCQTVFGAGVATGKFAMGSNDPLGTPPERETVDLDYIAASQEDRRETGGFSKGKDAGPSNKGKDAGPSNKGKHVRDAAVEEDRAGRKKRGMSEDDKELLAGMTMAVNGLSAAISEGNHAEAAPGIYDAVMGCEGFARTELMACLNHLMVNKGIALVFVGMKPEDKELWIKEHLASAQGRRPF